MEEKKIGMNGYSNGTANGTAIPKKEEQKHGILKRISNRIIEFFEYCFYNLGYLIGNHPWKTIGLSVLITLLFCIGCIKWTETSDNDTIWIPNDASVLEYKNWVDNKYPNTVQFVAVIFEDDNVLTNTKIQAIFAAYKQFLALSVSGSTLTDVCLKSGTDCIHNSVLELWSYTEATINGLSNTDIQTAVSTTTTSPMYNNDWDRTTVLGSISTSGSTVTGARAAKLTFLLNGYDSIVTTSEAWQKAAIDLAKGGFSGISKTYVFATRSFSDEGGSAIQGDIALLSGGYMLVIVYLFLVFGRVSCLEQRIGVSFCGLLVVGMSFGFSGGLSSASGWEYGPLHSVLPFLLLGIGVDDMFVIVGSYESLSHHDRQTPVNERIGKTLKHAGLSILVTSITDMLAFGIGATTTLPALKSFCVFASLGILGLFCLSATFFVACMTLDIKRMESKRNACLCCYKHSDDYTPNKFSQMNIMVTFVRRYYSKFLMKLPVKIVVIIITLGLLGLNIYGFYSLEQDFDNNWFLPSDSYASKYVEVDEQYFPDSGAKAKVYCKNIEYFSLQTSFDQLHSSMTSSSYISAGTVDSWFQSYTSWLNASSDASVTSRLDANKYPVDDTAFVELLHTYVNSDGRVYSPDILFTNTSGNLDIDATAISFQHVNLPKAPDEVKALDNTQNMIAAIFPNNLCFAYSRRYLTWETNKVIQRELYRNLGLAAACVFIITVILIANLWTSIMVFSCVIFTLLNVGGFMNFWGLTIDTVTCIQLVLGIGLAVDYSAHIGHCFMTFTGDRTDRVKATLVEIGVPVFSGGFSTFLAFILLAASTSYVFRTFFKVFFLVLIFGLFHGLVYLPVILSWLGPSPYISADKRYNDDESEDSKPKLELNGLDNKAVDVKVRHISNGRLSEPAPDYYDDSKPYIPPPDYTPPPSRKSGHKGRITPVQT